MKAVLLVAAVLVLAACSDLGPTAPKDGSTPVPTKTSPTPQLGQVGKVRDVESQLGVQIYWHEVNTDAAVQENATRLLDYVVGLGANSVGISFPIYTDGVKPTRVYTKPGVTPTADSLQLLISYAKARGLKVMVRPVIDESNIKNGHGAWRGSIKPPSVSGWFTSYAKTLLPFLTAAESARADTFVVGSELDSLISKASQWATLEKSASKVFTGKLSYADNWGAWSTGRPGVAGVVPGLDAYPQLHLSDSASVSKIAAAWKSWLLKHPKGLAQTVVQEVGIAATPGAYKEPAVWGSAKQKLAPQIQANWFAGACQAVKAQHMSGIYFWNLDAWSDPANAEGYDAGSFIGRGDAAIKHCFASGWPGQ